ncbi:MAG TPA: DnaJ domain-containing protein, partial [Ktedonobacteraceae bacterium]|nr:DnaJ domain-containing protein [Ktedonobacteraceae bacterium]
MIDYYALLEVSRDASLAQIKRAYRRLVRLYHPDVNKQAREDRIRQLNEAYEVLGDLARRAAYDALLLQELRNAALQELLRRQREEALRQPRMTWPQGIFGFVKELKKALRE